MPTHPPGEMKGICELIQDDSDQTSAQGFSVPWPLVEPLNHSYMWTRNSFNTPLDDGTAWPERLFFISQFNHPTFSL